jgi:hypothetical protein
MNKIDAQRVLDAYGTPSVKVGKTNVTFARQGEEQIALLEAKTDEELIAEWKSLVFLNSIYGQVSLNDLQRIDLIELEMENREDLDVCSLEDWYENTLTEFEESNFFEE